VFQNGLNLIEIVVSKFLAPTFLVWMVLTSGCTYEASKKNLNDPSDTTGDSNASSCPECTDDQLNTASCQITTTGKMITDTFGFDVNSWLNVSAGTTVTANIPDGYYSSKQVAAALKEPDKNYFLHDLLLDESKAKTFKFLKIDLKGKAPVLKYA